MTGMEHAEASPELPAERHAPDPPPVVGTRQLIGASFDLLLRSGDQMRRSSFYIGLIVLGTAGPLALGLWGSLLTGYEFAGIGPGASNATDSNSPEVYTRQRLSVVSVPRVAPSTRTPRNLARNSVDETARLVNVSTCPPAATAEFRATRSPISTSTPAFTTALTSENGPLLNL